MIDETPLIEPWLRTLRDDVQPMSADARGRLALRLASASVLAVAAPALATSLRRGFWYSRAFTAAVALPLGVVMGAAGHAYLVTSPAPVVKSVPAVSPPVAAPSAQAPRAVVEAAPAPPALGAAASAAPATPRAATAPTVKSEATPPSLEIELSLLERAKSKLSENQPQATLELLREHRARYPSSALQQEREALVIRALLAAGRRAEAKRRAQTFVRSYPSSALRGSVERATETIP